MDLNELEYFKMVCEQKSISKAAHALYMTPQGLRRIIKNIANEMEVTLMDDVTVGTGAKILGRFTVGDEQ